MSPKDIALTLIGLILTAWVATLIFRRKVHLEFPFFFVYLITSVVVSLLRLAVSWHYPTFFRVFWATEALYAVLALLTLHEVFHEVFQPFYMLWRWFRLIFPGMAALISLISIRNVLQHPPFQGSPRYLDVIFGFAYGVNQMEALLFGLFFALVLLLGVPWRSYPFGIVEGFGITALGALIAYRLRFEFGTKYNSVAKYGPAVAYVAGILVWLDTFLRSSNPEMVHAWREQITPQQLLSQARQYRRVVKGIFGRRDDP
jgi:hypothetical protein